jgi:transposase-like protein
MKNEVKTLADAIRYFADEQVCIDIVSSLRWPNGPECPKCSAHAERQHFLKAQKRFQCRDCGKQYSVKVGTIFEDSAIKLDKWLIAFWLLANCKNGISSYELAKDIGITQKSAWFVLQRIREAMRTGSIAKMGGKRGGGPVEVDECYVGPNPQRMHASRRAKLNVKERRSYKIPVVGMLDRDTRQVRATVIPEVSREVLMGQILDNVSRGSKVYTDDFPSYRGLKVRDFVHETVSHIDEYVRGEVHTNSIENFWSLLKRTLKGTYVAVEPFHLDRYVDEQVFRYNHRKDAKGVPTSDADRFSLAVGQVAGKRLTYAELTGKVEETDQPF